MSTAMELSQESLETIGAYVRNNLPAWLEQVELPFRREWEQQTTERIIRLEEELKTQRELMIKGFESVDKRFEDVNKRFEDMYHQMDKRFEQVDKRLEQVDKRFEALDRKSTRWFAVITIIISLMGLGMGAWGILGV